MAGVPTPAISSLSDSVGDPEELLLIEVAADRVDDAVLFPNQCLHHSRVVGDQYTRTAVDGLWFRSRQVGRDRDDQAARSEGVTDRLDLGDQGSVACDPRLLHEKTLQLLCRNAIGD